MNDLAGLSTHPFKVGDKVTWADDEQSQDCRETHGKGPFTITQIDITDLGERYGEERIAHGVHISGLGEGVATGLWGVDFFKLWIEPSEITA